MSLPTPLTSTEIQELVAEHGAAVSQGRSIAALIADGELPRLAQYLSENPDVSATVLAPYWAAQPWFQLLASVAARVEVAPLAEWARPPPGLPASAQHALSGATLVCFRVEGASLGGSTRAK